MDERDQVPTPPHLKAKAKQYRYGTHMAPGRVIKEQLFASAGLTSIAKKPRSEQIEKDANERKSNNQFSQKPRRQDVRRQANQYAQKIINDQFEDIKFLYEETDNVRAQLEADLKSPKGDDSFPYVLMGMALIKDISDPATAGMIAVISNTIFALAGYIYIRKRMGFSAKQAFRLLSRIAGRLIATFIAGLIPGINFLPEAMLMIFFVHHRHKKIVLNMASALSVIIQHQDQLLKAGNQVLKR